MLKTVCAIDAALNHSGYAICDDEKWITGIFTLDKNRPLQDKLLAISEWLGELIKKHKIDEIAMEGCYTACNPKTTYQLSLVHGAVMLTASRYGVKVAIIPPAKVKRAVTGRGNANKEDVARAVVELYSGELDFDCIKEKPHADDITDAIAILHMYMQGDNQIDGKGRKNHRSKSTTTHKRMKQHDIKENTTKEI